MNIYFIDPTYIKEAAWRPLLKVLKVKRVYSFFAYGELSETLIELIKPITESFYNGQDFNKYTNSCVFWLRAHLEKHVKRVEDEEWECMSIEDKKHYSQWSPFNNLINLDDSNALILLKITTRLDNRPPESRDYYDSEETTVHIASYCLNILHKKLDTYFYSNHVPFISIDPFFFNAYRFRRQWHQFESYLMNIKEKTYSFTGFIKNQINKSAPNDFPLIKKDNGKRYYTSIINDEGVAEAKRIEEIRDEEEEEERKRQEEEDRLYQYGESQRWQDEQDYKYMRRLLIEGGVWDPDD